MDQTLTRFDASIIEDTVRIKCVLEGFKSADLKNRKFKVPPDLTVGKFQTVLRQFMSPALRPEQAMFLLIKDFSGKKITEVIAPVSCTMASLRKDYGDSEGIVHIIVAKENVFGQ